jgi:hypothetical protein
MVYLVLKALISGVLIAVASEVARRWPGWGALIVSLPLVSLLAFVWLWFDARDPQQVAEMSQSTFWFILPSMPLFLVLPALIRSGVQFWAALLIACALTIALYWGMTLIGPRLGIRL